jgi:hypothetical protein
LNVSFKAGDFAGSTAAQGRERVHFSSLSLPLTRLSSSPLKV